MPNKRWNTQVSHRDPATGPGPRSRAPIVDKVPLKTAAWPGVPGNTQDPYQRDKTGTPRILQHMRKEGC